MPPSVALRVMDVAVWYGARSGGIRTYLDAKAGVAADTGSFEHHLAIPAVREHHAEGRHELPGVVVGRANGYRMPLDARPLLRTLAAIRPDVVMLHDPYWWPAAAVRAARRLGAAVIAVHHGTAAAAAIGRPGSPTAWRLAVSAWQRRLYQRVDAVMASGPPPAEAAGVPAVRLRYGVHSEFRPPTRAQRGDHVLYAGRLSPEKGVEVVLEAMAESSSRWPLRVIGGGPRERALRRRAARLGVRDRVTFAPFIAAPEVLCRAYAEAACVVVPGSHETFGLVALEAAASGATVLASDAVPAAHQARQLIHTFPAGDTAALVRAIANLTATRADAGAAEALGRRLTWQRAIAAELTEIGALCR
jgi:alpha-1,6-mannosyltransferase